MLTLPGTSTPPPLPTSLLAVTGGADVVGPMVLGLDKPVNVLQQGASVDSIVHMTAITAAQSLQKARAEGAR